MAVGNARIAPFINKKFTVTSPWWSNRGGTIHRGLDISTGSNDPVYSMLNGTVFRLYHNDASMGNAIIIKADDNTATLYMHLKSFTVNIGDRVSVGTQVGIEGTTGESTGIHTHVEMQVMKNNRWTWSYNKSDYLDPTQFMGIQNVKNSQWIYNGTPGPGPGPGPGPSPGSNKRRRFPWVLYARRLRKM